MFKKSYNKKMRIDLKNLFNDIHEKKYTESECLELFDSLNDALNNNEDFDYITILLCDISYVVHVNKLFSLNNKTISIANEILTHKLTNKQKGNVYYVLCLQYYNCSFGPKVFQYGLAFLNLKIKKDPINEITVVNYIEIVLQEGGLYNESYLYSKKYLKLASKINNAHSGLFNIIHMNNSCYILLSANRINEAIEYKNKIAKIIANPNNDDITKSFIPSLKFTVLYSNYYLTKDQNYLDEYKNIMDEVMNNKDFPSIAKQTVEPHLLFLKSLAESSEHKKAYDIINFMISNNSFVGNFTSVHRFLLNLVSEHPELVSEEEKSKIKDLYISDLEDYKEKQESIITLLYKEQMEYISINRSIKKLNKKYFVDVLTLSLNRASFEKTGLAFIRCHTNGCLVFIDIDNFKNFNDTYGHDFGDLILIEFAKTIRKEMSTRSKFYRYGGDEFVILLPFNKLKSESIMKRLVQICRETKTLNGKNVSIKFSYGICDFAEGNYDSNKIIKLADKNMYLYKKENKQKIN